MRKLPILFVIFQINRSYLKENPSILTKGTEVNRILRDAWRDAIFFTDFTLEKFLEWWSVRPKIEHFALLLNSPWLLNIFTSPYSQSTVYFLQYHEKFIKSCINLHNFYFKLTYFLYEKKANCWSSRILEANEMDGYFLLSA